MKRAADFRSIARERLSGHWIYVVLITAAAYLFGANICVLSDWVTWSFQIGEKFPGIKLISLPALILFCLLFARYALGSVLSLGIAQFYLALLDKKNLAVEYLFSRSSIWKKALFLRFRIDLSIFLWSLLLLIPGIIKEYSYSMAGFLMAENPNLFAKEAMQMSAQLMKGNKWRLFCLRMSFLGWAILSILTLGIGFFWLRPYMNAATTAFYDEVAREKK